jgi:uncharacterized protein DUF3108
LLLPGGERIVGSGADWNYLALRHGVARHGFAVALLLASGTAVPAAAEDLVASYSAYWAGLPAANIRLTLRDGGVGYHDEIEIATEGLSRLLTRFRATASAEGRRAADRTAEPSRYVAAYDLRKRRDSRVSLRFTRRADATVAERGPDDTSRKSPLAEAFRRNSVDPLSALERLREALRVARPGGSFSIPVYDGARRFDIIGRVMPKGGAADGTLRAELTLRPIAGFRGETSEDGDPDDAPRKVELVVTDDARVLPLSITVPVFFMPLVIRFEELCQSAGSCPNSPG